MSARVEINGREYTVPYKKVVAMRKEGVAFTVKHWAWEK